MKNHRSHLITLIACVLLVASGLVHANAANDAAASMAENLIGAKLFTKTTGFVNTATLYDGKLDWGVKTNANASLTMESDKGIASLYIRFSTTPKPFTVTNNETGESVEFSNRFIHYFADLQQAFGTTPSSVTVSFGASPVTIYEMYVYSPGQVPSFVQKWEVPQDGNTDLLLFSAHCDDEHLFFAGILPYYGGEKKYNVQVVYLSDHHNNGGIIRMREALDGLWETGITNYPVFGGYIDFPIPDKAYGFQYFASHGVSRANLDNFIVTQLRRFKPTVVVTHDFAGEYGHGQHKILAELVSEGVKVSMDPEQFPETAEKYGVWDVPKTYIHLYEENEIVMDWDQPLEAFDGMTAYEVSIQKAFQKHKSQIKDYAWYYRGADTAAQVAKYSPRCYGLYRSTVGEDAEKNDFFENTVTYAEQKVPAIVVTEPTEPAVTEEETAPTEQTVPTTQAVAQTEAAETEPEVITVPDAPTAPASKFPMWPILGGIAVLIVLIIVI